MEDLQTLLDRAYKNVGKHYENEKKDKRDYFEDFKIKVNSNTENLAKAIEELVGTKLSEIDIRRGSFNNLDCLLPFLKKGGKPNNSHYWFLTNYEFTLCIDLSFTIFDDELIHNGQEGLNESWINWELLKELLSKKNIYLNYIRDSINIKDETRGSGQIHKRILEVTLLKQKEIQNHLINQYILNKSNK